MPPQALEALEDGVFWAKGLRPVKLTELDLGRPFGYFIFSLIGLNRTLFMNIFQVL